jgi:hypothetical protein
MGKLCNTHGTDEKCRYMLLREPEGKDHLGDLDVDGRIVLKWIIKK